MNSHCKDNSIRRQRTNAHVKQQEASNAHEVPESPIDASPFELDQGSRRNVALDVRARPSGTCSDKHAQGARGGCSKVKMVMNE